MGSGVCPRSSARSARALGAVKLDCLTGLASSKLGDQDKPEYRALQPFGQVPILEEDRRVLFESGAIVLHIGELAASLCLLLKSLGMTSRRVHQSDDRRKGEGQ